MKKSIYTFLILATLLYSFGPIVDVYARNNNSGNNKSKKTAGVATSLPQYEFEVVDLSIPSSMKFGEIANLPIKIKNTSNFDWRSNGSNAVEIAYHWIDSSGQYEVYRGDVTALKKDIRKGQTSVNQTIQVRAPEIPGRFTFSLDLIQAETWFSQKGDSKYKVGVEVKGEIKVYDEPGQIVINSGAEYTNNSKVDISTEELSFQPDSDNAGFIFDYLQGGRSLNSWGLWTNISKNSKAKLDLGINEPFSGLIKVYARYRSFKKQSDATPMTYGEAQYHYGRASKTTGAWWDEIFFDNIPPQGAISINDGAASTTSKTVNLNISATDNLYGMTGSGLDGMRLDLNCNGNWGAWEAIANKSSVSLSGSSQLSACVQFKDKAGNISKVYMDTIIFYIPRPSSSALGGSTGVGIGTADNPYADLNSGSLGKPNIVFDRYIDIFGATKWNSVKSYDLPAPVITYIDWVDNDTVTIYGVGIRKYNPVDIEIWNQYRYCFLCGDGWEYVFEENEIGNSKLELFTENGSKFAELWNDDSQGQWSVTIDIGSGLSEGDKIYAKSTIYDKYFFDNLRWWESSTEGTVTFDADGLTSSNSNYLTLTSRADLLQRDLENKYGIDLQEARSDWTYDHLIWLDEAFTDINFASFSSSQVDIVLRDSVHSQGSGILGTYENATNTLTIFDSSTTLSGRNKYGTITAEEGFKINAVHELMHAFQAEESGNNNVRCPLGTSHLTNFYEISFNKTNNDYTLCRDWNNYDWAQDPNMTSDDFVTVYHPFPSEDLAEVVPVYVYTRARFDNLAQNSQIIRDKETYILNNVL